MSTRKTSSVKPITSRARSRKRPTTGNIQKGCTRFASASPRSSQATIQPRCTRSSCAACITYGASNTHLEPPLGTKTPSSMEYAAMSAGKLAALETPTNQPAMSALRCVFAMTAAIPA